MTATSPRRARQLSQNAQAPAPQEFTPKGPFRIKLALIQVEVEYFDPQTGKTIGRDLTAPLPIFESELPEGLLEFIKARGLSPSEPLKATTTCEQV